MAGSSRFLLTLTIQAQDESHAEVIARQIGQAVETLQAQRSSITPFVCQTGRLKSVKQEIIGAFRRGGKIWFVDCENAAGDIETSQFGSKQDALDWLESRCVTQIIEDKRLLSTRGVSLARALSTPAT